MKTTRWSLFVLLSAGVVGQSQTGPQMNPAALGYSAVERGQHHTRWSKLVLETNLQGQVEARTNAFVQVGTGLNAWRGGQWVEAAPELVLSNGWVVGRGAGHLALFASNLNCQAAVRVRMPDGQWIKTHLLGLAYHCGQTNLLIAEVKDSTPRLAGSNQVIYSDALTDFRCDVRYSYKRSGVAQEVIVRERPPKPETFGLPSASTHLLVISEVVEAPTPQLAERTWYSGGEVMHDQTVDWASMRVVQGRAFQLGNSRRARDVPVAKQFETIGDRRLIVERVRYAQVQRDLLRLPAAGWAVTNATGRTATNASAARATRWYAQGAAPPTSPRLVARARAPMRAGPAAVEQRAGTRRPPQAAFGGPPRTAQQRAGAAGAPGSFPGREPLAPSAPRRSVALPTGRESLDLSDQAGVVHAGSEAGAPGLVLDWELVQGTNWYFSCSETWLVEGETHLTTAWFEPQTVVKYDWGSSLHIDGPLYWVDNAGCGASNAVLTSFNDDAHGDWIDGSSGQPATGDYGPALVVLPGDLPTAEARFDIYYAAPVIEANGAVVAVAASGPDATKGGEAGEFTISRDGGDWTQPLTVSFSISGSAVTNRDYTPIGASATIPAYGESTTVAVHPLAPSGAVYDLSVVIHLEPDSAGAYTVGDPATAWVSIYDPTVPAPPPIPAPAGLVAWWRGEDDASDYAGGHHGTLINGATYGQGEVGRAFRFVSGSQRAYVPDCPAFQLTNQVTIEGWFKAFGGGALVVRGDDYIAPYCLLLDEYMMLQFLVAQSDDQGGSCSLALPRYPVGYAAPVGEWFHVAATLDADNADMRLYLNGQMVATANCPVHPLGALNPAADASLCIGNAQGTNIECAFDGLADEVSLYNRALLSQEIQAIYNAGRGGKATPPEITFQPTDERTWPGAGATFWVSARGFPVLTYQWYHGDTAIPGATGARLTLQNVGLQDEGGYKVTVSNPGGSVTSTNATLTVVGIRPPLFSPPGGTYGAAQNVTVTCSTNDALIHYTLDGREPTELDNTVASGSTVPVDHTLTLKAKAWKAGFLPSDTASAMYRIDQPPTVAISPPDGTSLLASDDLPLLVEASDPDGSVMLVQLFRGTTNLAASSTSSLQYTLTNLASGTYTFTAKATDDAGLQTVSSPVTVTVTASDPMVSLHGTQPIFTASPGTLVASVLGVNPGALASLTLNGVSQPLTTGNFTISVPLTEGQNDFTLVATDNQNRTNQASTTVWLYSTLPTVSISAPANGSTLNTTRVNVRGTFTTPSASIKRISVNGVPAFISGLSWEALNVPLVSGANTLTATAEDIAGNSYSAYATVTGDTALVDPVQLQASTVGGFASLQVTFTPQSTLPGIQQVLYDFVGNNSTFQTQQNLTPVTHTYDAGQFFPVVTIVTAAGRFSSLGGWNGGADRLRINVQSGWEIVSGSTISIADPVDLKWVPGGFLYVLSRSGASITEYDVSGTTPSAIRSVSGIGSNPNGLDVDSAGNVYVAVTGDNQVKKYKPDGTSLVLDSAFGTGGGIGTPGSGNGQFSGPFDVAVSPDGGHVSVSDSGNSRIQAFTSAGTYAGQYGGLGTALGQFNAPKGACYDSFGMLFVVDSGNNRVAVGDASDSCGASGTSGAALGQFQGPVNLGVGSRGVYVADTGNGRVEAFSSPAGGHGSPTPFVPRWAVSTELGLSQPRSAAPVEDLLEERVYIADTGNGRVILARFQSDNPSDVWTSMKQRLVAEDIQGALVYYSAATVDKYRQTLLFIGAAEVSTVFAQTPDITPVFIEQDSAQYRFQRVIQGVTLTFPVEFVRENGIWRIVDY